MTNSEKILNKKFAHEFINNGLNATQAYKTIKKTKTLRVANVLGSRMLSKVDVQQTILDMLPSDDVEAGIIKEAMSAQREANISWKDLRGYTELSLKLKGHLGSDSNKPSVNVGIVINQ